MKKTILLLTVLLLGTQSFAGDISASYSDSNFEEIFYVNKVESIEMWEQPRTQYTPKNLRTQYQVRYNGRTNNGVASYTLPIVDYDTKITKSGLQDGKYYVEDNIGNKFVTGVDNTDAINNLQQVVNNNTQQIQNNSSDIINLQTQLDNTNTQVNTNTQNIQVNIDRLNQHQTQITQNTNQIKTNTTNIQKNVQSIQNVSTQVQNNTKRITENTTRIQANSDNIRALGNNIQRLDTKVDKVVEGLYRLDDKVDKGLATVTALTSLHPNPRHKGKTQIAIGSGMYNHNVAGAVGIFHHLNDNVMLNAGVSYGGSHSWAANVGISIGF